MSDRLDIGLIEETPRCPICGAPFYGCIPVDEDVPPAERPGWFRSDGGTSPCPPPQPPAAAGP